MPSEEVGARAVPARWLWTPEGVVPDATVLVDTRDCIVGVRPARVGDGVPFDGLVVPGLVNGHTHVELSDLAERVGPGGGFVAWVERMFGVPRGDAVASARSAALYPTSMTTPHIPEHQAWSRRPSPSSGILSSLCATAMEQVRRSS